MLRLVTTTTGQSQEACLMPGERATAMGASSMVETLYVGAWVHGDLDFNPAGTCSLSLLPPRVEMCLWLLHTKKDIDVRI